VLDAARRLFESQGYAETTVRSIARDAGVSVGSVFTSFPSKSEILSQVMAERLDDLYGELDRAAPQLSGSAADRLKRIFRIYFEFETRRVRLFLAHIAAAYDWTLSPDAAPYGRNLNLRQTILDLLEQGVAQGDVDPGTDPVLIMETLLAAYGWTYRLVVWEAADAARLAEVMDRHIDLIARGFAPRGA
jgi:AcrR family transcriptional regulator